MRTGLSQHTSMRQELRVNPRLYQAMDMLYMPMMDLQQHLKQELLANPFLELLEPEEESARAEGRRAGEGAEGEGRGDGLGGDPPQRLRGGRHPRAVRAAGVHRAGHGRDQGPDRPPARAAPDADADPAPAAAGRGVPRQHQRGGLSRRLARGDPRLASTSWWPGHVAAETTETTDDVEASTRTSRASEARRRREPPPALYTMAEAEEMLAHHPAARPARHRRARPPGVPPHPARRAGGHDVAHLPAGARRVPRPHRPPVERPRQALRRRARARCRPPPTSWPGSTPSPASSTPSQSDGYIIPDLIVEKIGGRYQVFLNDTGMPRLRLSRSYQEIARDKKKMTPENREFIASKMNSANWMIQAIEQRRQTMLKVMNFIVDRQRDFFEKGIEYLKPLTLREVAEVINMHESTVSRVTNEKYVQTPRGVLPLKFFFSSALATASGEDASARSHPGQAAEDGGRGGQREAAHRPADRAPLPGAGHPDRPPHGRQVPRPARHPAGAHAEAGMTLARRRDAGRQRPRPGEGRGGQPSRVRPALRRGARARAGFTFEVVVVDDGSRDDSAARAARARARPIPFLRVVTPPPAARHRRRAPLRRRRRPRATSSSSIPPTCSTCPRTSPRSSRRSSRAGPTSSPAPSRGSTRRRSSPASTTGSAAGCSASASPTSTR